MNDAIITELSDAVAIIRFNRPAERNPLSLATLEKLSVVLESTLAQKHLRTIIFTGAEDVFASGAHIGELTRLDSTSAKQFSQHGQHLFQIIADAGQKTVAAVNGYCMGGALDLALACDIRVASRNAVFSHPGARLGIITGWGGTQRLPRIIGKTRALEMLVTAKRITGEEALNIGLVSKLGDPVLECALEFVASP